jgi:hypothetical protein
MPRVDKATKLEAKSCQAAGGGEEEEMGLGSDYLIHTGFLFGVMEMFWNEMVVMVAH